MPKAYSNNWEAKKKLLLEKRIGRLENAARARTDKIRLVVQDVHQPHNVSACLRSAEAFGIESVDIVILNQKFKPSTVAKGSSSWLRMNKWNSVDECSTNLKSLGYSIATAYPSQSSDYLLQNLPTEKPIAVVFANEHSGASPEWEKHTDYKFTIPMFGLVESFNISVSCAITLHHLHTKMSQNKDFTLNEDKMKKLLDYWSDFA